MSPVDLPSALEQSLSPADVRLPGAALYRKLSVILKGTAQVSGPAFKRIGQDRSLLMIRLTSDHEDSLGYGRPFFLDGSGPKVRAFAIPGGTWGAYLGEWRRDGDRIVGTSYGVNGNWRVAVLTVLVRGQSGWKLASSLVSDTESREIKFVGSRLDRLEVTNRSYGFRRFDQAHVGPLLLSYAPWTIRGTKIAVGPSRFRRTPLYDLDRFADAVLKGDRTARTLCLPGLYRRAKQLVRAGMKDNGMISVGCPRSIESDTSRYLGWGVHDQQQEPQWFFELSPWNRGWRIAKIRRLSDFPSRAEMERTRSYAPNATQKKKSLRS